MIAPKLVLIDLDGTLIDSVPDLAYAVDAMMTALELPQCGEQAVRKWVGNGIERLVKRALTDDLYAEPDNELYERALPLFNKAYTQCNGLHSRLYPHVREGLDWLKAHDYTVACVTNKAEQFTLPLLKTLGIHDDFALIISGDSLPKKKPDPMPLLHAAAHFNISPKDALMIGDSINDVQAARAADFHVICVPYGYNHGEDIHLANPDVVIDSFAELAQVLAERGMH
jgi:phosphoglycolate phosphatase